MTGAGSRADARAGAGVAGAAVPLAGLAADLVHALHPELRAVFDDLHTHPEIAYEEVRTTAVVARQLRALGVRVTEARGVTGLVGTLSNGPGPVVALRADIDALPIRENSGLPYASSTDAMHACGHDLHTTALIGAVRVLAEHPQLWSGTVVVVAQPAEEVGSGAQALIDSGVFAEHPTPDVVLGQHTGGDEAGVFSTRPGPYEAGQRNWEITLRGPGGHAAGPHRATNLVVAAASLVVRLNGLVPARIPAGERAVLVPATIHGGTATNILPAEVTVGVCARALSAELLDELDAAVRREVRAIAVAEALSEEPSIRVFNSFPVNTNDADALATARAAIEAEFGDGTVRDVEPILGSEDFGTFGTHFGVPSAYWHFGTGVSPLAGDPERARGGHSPYFAPDADRAISIGTRALLVAALAWLAPR